MVSPSKNPNHRGRGSLLQDGMQSTGLLKVHMSKKDIVNPPALDSATSSSPVKTGKAPVTNDGWLQDRDLLYRLKYLDGLRPANRDEIKVTMADGSRSIESCTRRAGELLDRIKSSTPAPQPQAMPEYVKAAAELEYAWRCYAENEGANGGELSRMIANAAKLLLQAQQTAAPVEADDGDMLRLARAHCMTISYEASRNGWSIGAVVKGEFKWLVHDKDQNRAIVRAAAAHVSLDPTFKVNHKGGVEAVTANMADAITAAATSAAVQQPLTDEQAYDLFGVNYNMSVIRTVEAAHRIGAISQDDAKRQEQDIATAHSFYGNPKEQTDRPNQTEVHPERPRG